MRRDDQKEYSYKVVFYLWLAGIAIILIQAVRAWIETH